MAGKIATRAAYGEALVELAEQYPELVVFDADLSNATMTKGFAAKYPERFFDMGIAECNMTGVAAGMSTCGFKPFTNTFAIFASGRAWEQVRNSIGYPHLNVKVVGSHGGLSVGEDGATHQCTEDLALMRVIPGMKVLCPCDGYEMKLAVKALLEYDGPAYLRLGRAAVETVTDEIEGYRFELDKGVTLKDGKDVTVIATGLMVQMALKAREMMAAEGISVRVIDMHTIKPLDGELVRKAALETGCIVTSEEHSIIGGLGGAVAEYLSENCPTPLVRHGVNDAFGRSGTANAVLEAYGLTPEVLCDKIREGWINYSNPELDIICEGEDGKRSAVSPSAIITERGYEMSLIFRNNSVSEELPEGIFHAHPEFWPVKQEPIGLIEAQGLFILPGRLVDQLGIVEEALAEGRDLPDEVSEFSLEWGELAETLAGNHDREAIRQAVHDELGSVCYRILGNTAVFKQKATTQTFLESLGFAAR